MAEVTFWVMAISFVIGARALARAAARRMPMFWQNAVIVGAGDVGQLIARKLQQHPEYAIKLVGFVDARPREPRTISASSESWARPTYCRTSSRGSTSTG